MRTPAEGQATPARTGAGEEPCEPVKKWRGREVGSDVPEGGVEPAIGTGVKYEFRPDTRYVSLGKPPGGTTDSAIVYDRADGKKKLFKPERGEKVVDYAEERGVEKGQYAPRAKASELTIERLGGADEPGGERLPGMETPGVELVRIGNRRGSLTEWIEPTGGTRMMSLEKFLWPDKKSDVPSEQLTADVRANQRLADLQSDPAFRDAWNNIQAVDFLINNLDRVQNYGNYLIELEADGSTFKRLVPIDSELSFTTTAERAVIEKKTEFLDRIDLSDAMIDRLLKLSAERHQFADQIRPLVGDVAVEGVIHRLDQLVERALQLRAMRQRQP